MNVIDKVHKYLQPGRSWIQRNVNTIKVLTVHHDAIPHDGRSAEEVLQQIFNTHKGEGWPGASYHYYIHNDGKIYKLNNHEDVTWHDTKNFDSLGIVVHGYFHPNVNNKTTREQQIALYELLTDLCTKHPEFPADFNDVYCHRERAATACPGDNFAPQVIEFREKLGQVGWGTPSTPTPPAQPQITEDTVIPQVSNMTVREIKLRIQDLEGRINRVRQAVNG